MKALGLRGQILSALCTALLLSFSLLAIAVVQISRRARQLDQHATAETLARTLAAAYRDEGPAFDVLATELVAAGTLAGLSVTNAEGERRVWGKAEAETMAAKAGPRGSTVRVMLSADPSRDASLTNLLLLYVGVSGAGILLFGYVVLTLLIVRPVSALTRASERLSAGNLQVEVPVSGAGEIASLATSFNGMALQLREDRKALEARLQELESTTAQLRSAQDQLVRSAQLASVGRLSAGLAHEIGNPLAAILGLVELLQGTDLSQDKRHEFLERIHRETQRIHKVLQDLLAFARREGPAEEEQGVTLLEEVVDESIALVRPQKDLRHIVIRKAFEKGPHRVAGNPNQWTQVMVNLLLNAADAIVQQGEITVALSSREKTVVLEVRDTGSGIDEALLPQVFEPFVTSKEAGKGTGLGLSVCQTLVERAGGRILARNNEGAGATLEVQVPEASSR